jgi:hypothetical protein
MLAGFSVVKITRTGILKLKVHSSTYAEEVA